MDFNVIEEARRVFDIEIDALKKTEESLGEDFEKLVTLVMECKGKVILTGMGKPGHIARKMSATLASLGTPSFFMHPGEAMHGDLGMVESKDIVVIMSYSGESDEVVKLLPVLKEIGCVTVAVTGKPKSSLSKGCDNHIFFPPFDEACYMHLAPTSSTTALLVLGDALAVVCAKARNYTKNDFGLHHPAGALGKKLLVRVEHLMHKGKENAVVGTEASLREAIVEMSTKGLSMISILDAEGHLCGILTDGDLRRMLEKGVNVYEEKVKNVMTSKPKVTYGKEMAVDALQVMNSHNITCMPVVDSEGKAEGAILLHDIVKAGIV